MPINLLALTMNKQVKFVEVLQLLLTRSQQVSMEMSGCNVSWADLWKAEPQSKQFLSRLSTMYYQVYPPFSTIVRVTSLQPVPKEGDCETHPQQKPWVKGSTATTFKSWSRHQQSRHQRSRVPAAEPFTLGEVPGHQVLKARPLLCIEDTSDWKKAKYSELVEDSSSTGGRCGVSH